RRTHSRRCSNWWGGLSAKKRNGDLLCCCGKSPIRYRLCLYPCSICYFRLSIRIRHIWRHPRGFVTSPESFLPSTFLLSWLLFRWFSLLLNSKLCRLV